MADGVIWGLAALLGALGLAALATWARAAQRARQARAAYPPRGRFLQVNGHRVHVHQVGEGPDLVILHGATSQMIEPLEIYVQHLQSDFRITLIDRPGQGYTPRLTRQGESLRAQAELMDDTCAALGLERFTLLGQSFGGSVALAWAVHRPERLQAMALVGTPAYRWLPALPWRIKGPAMPVIGPMVAHAVSAWFPQRRFDADYAAYFTPRPLPEGYGKRIGLRLSLLPEHIVSDNRQLKRMQDDLTGLQARYGEIRIPVEILFGADDVVTAPQLHGTPLTQDIPGARLKLLKGEGHMLHVGGARDLAETVRRAHRRARSGQPERPAARPRAAAL